MAERNLSSDVIALIVAKKVKPVVFLFADFPSGARRLWTGSGSYNDGVHTWQGIGGVVKIGSVGETTDLAAQGIKVTLSGLEESLVNSILNEEYQGHRAEMWLGFWNATTVILPEEPIWRGTLDTDDSTIAAQGTELTINCEHRMVDILRKREIRCTSQDQKYLHPDVVDTAFDRIEIIQDKKAPWGPQPVG